MKISTIKVIELSDWNNLVRETYGRPYHLQQQDGCREKGLFYIVIPSESDDEFMNDNIPEEVNGDEMGVKFKTWLERDPDQPIQEQKYDWELKLFWERNFYPDIQTVANDLFKKGLIEAGEYNINISW